MASIRKGGKGKGGSPTREEQQQNPVVAYSKARIVNGPESFETMQSVAPKLSTASAGDGLLNRYVYSPESPNLKLGEVMRDRAALPMGCLAEKAEVVRGEVRCLRRAH